MSYSFDKRMETLERRTNAERAVITENRRIVLSMVEDFVRISSKPPEEARRYFMRCLPPELVAHLADDWETNPLTLEALRIVNQRDGHYLLYERSLEYIAQASGLETDEMIQLFLLDSRCTLEQLLLTLRMAHRRKLPFVLVNLHGPDLYKRVEEKRQRHAEIDEQARERLTAKGYTADEIEQILTQAGALRAKFEERFEPEQLEDDGICEVCGAANDVAAKVARRFSEFAASEGFTAEQCEQGLTHLTATNRT